jgi:hypothetical protein
MTHSLSRCYVDRGHRWSITLSEIFCESCSLDGHHDISIGPPCVVLYYVLRGIQVSSSLIYLASYHGSQGQFYLVTLLFVVLVHHFLHLALINARFINHFTFPLDASLCGRTTSISFRELSPAIQLTLEPFFCYVRVDVSSQKKTVPKRLQSLISCHDMQIRSLLWDL